MTISTKSPQQPLSAIGIVVGAMLLLGGLYTGIHPSQSKLGRTLAEKVVEWCDIQLLFL